MTQEVVKPNEAGELDAPLSSEEQALAERVKGRVDKSKLVLPALKVLNGLSQEVSKDGMPAGHLINALTKEDFGDSVEVVIVGMFEGRFYSTTDGDAFATQAPVAPSNWPEEYAGKAFADLPDSEENWKAAVNAGEHDWGDGPPIATTYNFVCIQPDNPGLPLRLSLMRSNAGTAAKVQTLIAASRAPWDKAFKFSAVRRTRSGSSGIEYYGIDVAQGGVTPPELRQAAVTIALEIAKAEDAGNVELAGDSDDKGAKSKPTGGKGGLGVS